MRKFATIGFLLSAVAIVLAACAVGEKQQSRGFNEPYTGSYLARIAFPVGGMGAGMFCVEGTGAISHMSVRNAPSLFNEPCVFAAIHVKGAENGSKVIEGNVPEWKKWGRRNCGLGSSGMTWGLPRF